jgi:transposase
VSKFTQPLRATFEAEHAKLTALSKQLFDQLYEEFGALDKRLASYNEQIAACAAAPPVCQRLETIPGIGPLTATAVIAAVSEAAHFQKGRQFAAGVGLVPRQHATGGKARLLGISQRGNVYLRTLLVHGARATLRWIGVKTDQRSQWLRALMTRRGQNKAAVALANKNARMAWVLLSSDQTSTA